MDFIVIEGDIAQQRADALVAASDTTLKMNGGTARAIRDAGGDGIHEAAIESAPIEPGAVVVTDGFALPAQHVVHAAAKPAGGSATADTVRMATVNALKAAESQGCQSIVVPLLGAGVGGLNTEEVANVMIAAVSKFESSTLTDIRLIAYSTDDRVRFQRQIDHLQDG